MKRTILFILSIALIISCLSTLVIASCAELFPGYPKKWMHRNNNGVLNQVVVECYDVNMNSNYSIAVSSGQNIWTSPKISGYSLVTCPSASNTFKSISHVAAVKSEWEAICGGIYSAQSTYATTRPYDSNGNIMISGANTTSLIANAIIYYPRADYGDASKGEVNIFSPLTSTQKYSIVAHEVGHALGFAHISSNSIMQPGQYSYTSLQQQDIDNLLGKYSS